MGSVLIQSNTGPERTQPFLCPPVLFPIPGHIVLKLPFCGSEEARWSSCPTHAGFSFSSPQPLPSVSPFTSWPQRLDLEARAHCCRGRKHWPQRWRFRAEKVRGLWDAALWAQQLPEGPLLFHTTFWAEGWGHQCYPLRVTVSQEFAWYSFH